MTLQRFKLNRKGVHQLLRSDQVEAELRRRAERVSAAAGPGMLVDSEIGRARARASVRTGTPEAVREQRKTKALSRAFDAARG